MLSLFLIEFLDRVPQRLSRHGRSMLIEEREQSWTIDIARSPQHLANALVNEVFLFVYQQFGDRKRVVGLLLLQQEVCSSHDR